MEHIDLKTRILLVRLYYENGSSAAAALRRYKTINGLCHDPFSVRAVERLLQKFEEHGVVTDLPRSGRPSFGDDTVEIVQHALQRGQSSSQLSIYSARAISKETGICKTTVLKVLKDRLHMHPYHLQLVHELKPQDFESRMEFANWFLEQDEDFVERILWTDEAHFHLDGSISNKNCVIWASNNPNISVSHSLHPQRVTVWCGLTAKFILPPFFIEGETVNGERHLHILQNHMKPNLPRRSNVIFMQDGAPPHIAKPVKEFLLSNFGEKVISRHFPRPWPPRSPDLNPCDYFLWGYLKHKVFLRNPQSINDLKEAIVAEIYLLDGDILKKTIASLFDRLLCVLSVDGRQVE